MESVTRVRLANAARNAVLEDIEAAKISFPLLTHYEEQDAQYNSSRLAKKAAQQRSGFTPVKSIPPSGM